MNTNILQFTSEFGAIQGFNRDGVSYVNLEDTVRGLGYLKGNGKGGKFIRKDYVANICDKRNLGILGKTFKPSKDGLVSVMDTPAPILSSQDFSSIWVTKGDFFDLALESRAYNARAFRKWVVNDVLVAIDEQGGYILPNATTEQIDTMVKFHPRNLRKTFAECPYEQFQKTYDAFIAHYTCKKGVDRRSLLLKVEDGLNDKLELTTDNVIQHGCHKLLNQIKDDLLHLSNKVNGGQKAHKTYVIKTLEDKVVVQSGIIAKQEADLKDKTLPPWSRYYVIDVHGLSSNKLFFGTPSRRPNPNNRTEEYNKWIAKFPYNQLPDLAAFGITNRNKPVEMFLGFKYKRDFINPNGRVGGYDVHNFSKSAIDVICNHYGMNDRNVKLLVCEEHGRCDTEDQGKIFLYMRPQTIQH